MFEAELKHTIKTKQNNYDDDDDDDGSNRRGGACIKIQPSFLSFHFTTGATFFSQFFWLCLFLLFLSRFVLLAMIQGRLWLTGLSYRLTLHSMIISIFAHMHTWYRWNRLFFYIYTHNKTHNYIIVSRRLVKPPLSWLPTM